jgi:hypothetical protein
VNEPGLTWRVIQPDESWCAIRPRIRPPIGLDEYPLVEEFVSGNVHDILARAFDDEAAALFAVDAEVRACCDDSTGNLVHDFLLPGIKIIQRIAATIKRKAESSGFISPPCFPAEEREG